jgi:DNA-binding HxlR family transcriptional regulator
MLTERLKELQDEGIVERIFHDETPVIPPGSHHLTP